MKKKWMREKLCIYRKTNGAHLSTYLADWDRSESTDASGGRDVETLSRAYDRRTPRYEGSRYRIPF
jgi:hypothetical protein